jgi:hypothetical protein
MCNRPQHDEVLEPGRTHATAARGIFASETAAAGPPANGFLARQDVNIGAPRCGMIRAHETYR